MACAELVLGNTGCLSLRGNCIPFYRIREKEWILLDSGSRFVREELDGYLEQNEIRIRAVLCSHAHFDHTENNRYLQEKYGAEIVMTAYDAGTVYDTTALKSCFYSYTVQDNETYNREMLCAADRVLLPGQKQVEVEGAVFRVLSLPGHAASHLGFVTPDGVAYLADSVFSMDQLKAGRLIYMLCWSETLKTLEKVKKFQYDTYILAHYGVVDEIASLAEENIQWFSGELDRIAALCRGEEASLDELVRKISSVYGGALKNYERVRVFERSVRAAVEYLVETKRLSWAIRDGVVVYL